MKIKILAIVVIFELCTYIFNPMMVYAGNHKETKGEKLKERYESIVTERFVYEDDSDIMYKLDLEYNKIQEDMIVDEKEDGSLVYKDTYSGAYIDEDKLVVCVTQDEEIKDKTEDVEYRLVERSYNDLAYIQDKFGDLYTEYCKEYNEETEEYELLSDISGFGIDEEKNIVIVDIVELNNQKIELFERIFGKYDCVEFENVENMAEDSATYKPGSAIYVIIGRTSTSISYISCSMGYRAYRKTSESETGFQNGFVTCGHGVKDSVDKKIYSSSSLSTVIGTIEATMYSGSVDASFVKKKSGVAIDTSVQYNKNGGTTNTDEIATYYYMTYVAKGSTVYKVGATTYKTSAKVTSTNYTCTINGKKFTNLTQTGKFAASGDSGGIVYVYYDSKYVPAGIMKACSSSYSYYVKATEILTYMNIYAY